MSNPKNYLFMEFLRVVSELKPDWFLFENVPGIKSMEGGKVVELIKDCFVSLSPSYTVSDDVLSASDYGVPQHRKRWLLVGNKHGIDFSFPPKEKAKVSVQEAISDLPLLENGSMIDIADYAVPEQQASEYARKMRCGTDKATQNYVTNNKSYVIERYRHVGQGENWEAIPAELMGNYTDKSRCHSCHYRRLKANSPSITIVNYRKNMIIHPVQDRGLSVREVARIQSFPDWFTFEGPLGCVQQQLTNAVPPLLACAVVRQIILTA